MPIEDSHTKISLSVINVVLDTNGSLRDGRLTICHKVIMLSLDFFSAALLWCH